MGFVEEVTGGVAACGLKTGSVLTPMTRIAVVGASGNVGTALLSRLASAPDVEDLTAIARRVPSAVPPYDSARWVSCNVAAAEARSTLEDAFRGADTIVQLAWTIQPSHDERYLRRINVGGSVAALDAAAAAGVGHIVYASSVGTYAPGPKDHPVDESWPATGVSSSSYGRHKAAVESWLDDGRPATRMWSSRGFDPA